VYKVLIVDDEYLIRNGISKRFNWAETGFTVIGTASNGQDALIEINKNIPDVVITDIRMPILDGIELCKTIRYRYPQIKIIILSGYSEFEYAQKAIEYGVYYYLLKPLNESELRNVLKKLYFELEKTNTNSNTQIKSPESKNLESYERADAVFNRIIQSTTSDVEHERNELRNLGITLAEKHMSTIAFTYDIKKGNTQIELPVIKILGFSHKYWMNYNYPVFYFNQFFYIVFNEKKRLNKSYINRETKKFTESLSNYLKEVGYEEVSISYGISNTYSNLARLKNSVYESQQALQFKFYTDTEVTIFYNDIQNQIKTDFNKTQINAQIIQLVSSMIKCNKNQTILSFKAILSILRDTKILNKQVLLVKCVQIYISIVEQLKSENINIKFQKEEDFYQTIAKANTFTELSELFEKTVMYIFDKTTEFQTSDNNKRLVQKMKDYVKKHYNEKLSLAQMAEVFYMNPTYISTFFKEQTGMNLFDYIFDVRMTEAKKLLKNSDYQIQAIAVRVGYPDFRHFCTVFKKATGLTPLQYRMNSIWE
jgi:two-component system response regulator YesN